MRFNLLKSPPYKMQNCSQLGGTRRPFDLYVLKIPGLSTENAIAVHLQAQGSVAVGFGSLAVSLVEK
ncbi:hypothetical protein DXV75_05445 [Alteromonas aestuariivivens]|uniref:Uncharacterized protein n=1 Tax=Alteromonas aestuariivivens TaxID=1938339 RepID=A0A3D8MCR9_9ALTE|nr:hypothetical protein DXV75_05445 [Alteromonas aestuariivivens]